VNAGRIPDHILKDTELAARRFLPRALRPETFAGRQGKALGHHQRDAPAVTNPLKFKAPYNSKERIGQEADRLRTAHPTDR
jgi:hypothetical protein